MKAQVFTKLNVNLFIEMDIILILLTIFVVFIFGWCFIGFSLQNELILFESNKYFENKNILLIIAHPDDESMFFSPFLSYLSHKLSIDNLYILSLSNGGNENRSKELKMATNKIFGIRNKNVKVINDTKYLKDDINLYWDNNVMIKYINEHIEKHKIDMIFSFDNYGISGHPNHISIYNALKYGMDNNLLFNNISDIYLLKSVSKIRKFSFWLEPMLYLTVFMPFNLNVNKSNMVILSSPNKCYEGMTYHESQFVWYRKLFVIFSRYGWMNHFHRLIGNKKYK